MADFNQEAPPKKITDPDGIGANAAYPRHVYKAGGAADRDKNWTKPYTYLIVHNDDEKQRALKDGWSLKRPGSRQEPAKPAGASE